MGDLNIRNDTIAHKRWRLNVLEDSSVTKTCHIIHYNFYSSNEPFQYFKQYSDECNQITQLSMCFGKGGNKDSICKQKRDWKKLYSSFTLFLIYCPMLEHYGAIGNVCQR